MVDMPPVLPSLAAIATALPGVQVTSDPKLPPNRRDRPSAMQSDLSYVLRRKAEVYLPRDMPGGTYKIQPTGRPGPGRFTVLWRWDSADAWTTLPERFNSVGGALDYISTDPQRRD